MLIMDDLKDKIKEAMKARDQVRLSTLKMLSNALHNAKIDKLGDLTNEEEMEVVKKEAKKRKDSIEAYKAAGREELANNEAKELDVLKEFLPEELSHEELVRIVTDSISESGAESIRDMGKVMALAMNKVAGRADGSMLSSIVKEKLNA